MRSLACLLFVMPVLGLAQDAGPVAPTETPAAPAAPTAVDYAKRLDELFDTRGPAAIDQEHDRVAAEALKARPDDFEVLWRVARWKVWISDGLTQEKQKAAVGKEAWDVADKARKVKPDSALGHYYAAAGVGIYSQGIGILNAIGQGIEGKFNERLDRAIALDPTVDSGGPWLAKGRYFFELPWPMRDLGKSRALLEKATAKFPNNLRAQLYLAETLLKDGKGKEAKATYEKVFSNPGNDPAEAKRVRAMAKKIEAEINKAQ